jgi:hypothetical protein
MTMSVSLFKLDLLPPKCSIESDVEIEKSGQDVYVRKVRFRAKRRVGWLGWQQRSDWSGWFRYDGEPIALSWELFWP